MPVGELFLSGVVSAFLQVAFDRLAPKSVLDLIRRHGIENDLKGLHKTLTKVEAYINDAEDKQFKNTAVRRWLEEFKDAAYDAEDVLDEFTMEALGQKVEAEPDSSSPKEVRSPIRPPLRPKVSISSTDIKSKIAEITKRFDDLANERFDLGLEQVAAGNSSLVIGETSSVVDESRVYGRDTDKEKIIKLLLKDEPKITVIPIIGMGGIGKTTMAQVVYNDDRVDEHFDLKAWACVSQEFDVKRITKSILRSFTSETSDPDDLNQVQVKVKVALAGQEKKKFLIVLDDVWSKKYGDWDVLQNPFRVGAPGNKIIVTTRNTDVALMMGTVDNYYLTHLSRDDCWKVFKQHAFGDRNIESKPWLKEIGEQIVEKCKGLPLAAKTLGGLLCSKLKEDEWKDILNSYIWELSEKETDILPVLRLSYHDLPLYLKRCFAYCSILPKGYEFEEMELVLLWMAEGLVQQPNGSKQMEDIGVEYFQDLVSRSFFQLSSSKESHFIMHDLINDLAKWVAGNTSFRLEDKQRWRISKKARHSSYIGEKLEVPGKFKAFDEVMHLRTFLPLLTPNESSLPSTVPLRILAKLKFLRVLSLSSYKIKELPKEIDAMKNLRYLDLSHTLIRVLPEKTTNLYNLQTLKLAYCSELEKLPLAMENLVNLRFLDFTNADLIKEMPPRVGKLTSLQKLSNFIVGEDSETGIAELVKLKHLRGTLHISKLDNVIPANGRREAILRDKQNLDEVVLEWSGFFRSSRTQRDEKEVLEMLQPNKMLKNLTIKCYGGTEFPMWMGDFLSGIVLLKLEYCVECTSLPPLGQLPLLKDLYITGMKNVECVGKEFYGEDCPKPFPSLETLSFVDMQKWKNWLPPGVGRRVEEVFPGLCKLSIDNCPKLPKELLDLPSSISCRSWQFQFQAP